MSTEPSSQTEAPQYDYDGHIMRTPAEWCRIHQVEILDADGWRGRDAKPWEEPLTELDFMERLNVCTQRSTAPQPAGEHHTGTLNLTDQAGAPVSVLYWCPTSREIEQHPGGGFDTCCQAPEIHEPVLTVVYAAIRQQVAEQIAAAIEGCVTNLDQWPGEHYREAAAKAREIGGQA